MGIYEDGPTIKEWTRITNLDKILAILSDDSIGTSVQKFDAGSNELVAIADQIAGKVGPMIGKWDPEKSSRMIQEF